jgi:hypothetical protein
MNLEQVMERIGDQGVTVIIKLDGERDKDGLRWTFVASGGSLASYGPIRVDASTMGNCLSRGFFLMSERGPEWNWLEKFSPAGDPSESG